MAATDNLGAVLKQLRVNPEVVKAIPALVARFGTTGAVALARGYLGPLAPAAQRDDEKPVDAPAGSLERAAHVSDSKRTVAPSDTAVLGLALTKLVYELGELALHNPSFDAKGKQPEFKLDEHGRTPAMSVTHVVAVARMVQAYRADQRAAEAAAAPPPPTPRARLQAARTERYAATPRYSYVARPVTFRAPR
jgi:hypothetical protein